MARTKKTVKTTKKAAAGKGNGKETKKITIKEIMSENKQFIFDLVLAGVLGLLVAFISMGIWYMDLNVPAATGGDGMLGLMLTKSIKERGLMGVWLNPSIGAPEVSALVDSPFLDYVMVFELWILTKICSVSASFYMVYILSYLLASIMMYILLNHISKNRWINLALSVLYAATPYHFTRGMGHLTLSNYYMLPIAILLAIFVLEEEFKGGMPECVKNSRGKKILFILAIVMIGFSNVYYAFFSMMLILIAGIYKMVNQKTIRPFFHELRIFMGMAVCFILGVMPKLIYAASYGTNEVAVSRNPIDTDVYALRIIQMLLPGGTFRLGKIKELTAKYNAEGFGINENLMAALGIVATIGFFGACIWVVLKYAGKRKEQTIDKSRMDFMAVAILVLVLYSSVGGFGTIFSYLVIPELRCLNRVSIVIATLSIAIVGILLNWCMGKMNKNRFYGGLLVCFLGVLYLEVPVGSVHGQDGLKESYRIYQAFFGELENRTEEGDMIYQLPMRNFPESPALYNMMDYALFRGYVYTDGLKWSYGGVIGRNNRALELYVDEGMSRDFVSLIRRSGFSGVYIDADGFEDGGVAINQFYQNELGLEPLVSENGKLYFYSLKES